MSPFPATSTSASSFIATPPNVQLHSASGWTIPPLDGSLSVPEMYDFHLAHNPSHPVFVYASTNNSDIASITFSDLVPAAHRAGWLVTRRMDFDHSADPTLRPTVAVLAASDTITFFTTFVGMFRAGIPFLPISPRNSAAAVAHLIQKTRPTHVIISADAAMHELWDESLALLPSDVKQPVVLAMPVYQDIYTGNQEFERLPLRPRNIDVGRIIVHSSGSTSFPKPVEWNDRTCGQASMAPWYGTKSHTGQVFAAHCLAMYHGIGLNFMNWISTTGLTLAVFPPSSPAIIPSFDNVWRGAVTTNPDYVFAPPVFFEIWSKDPDKVNYLSKLKHGLVFGGAPMSKVVGDYLAREGCSLYSLYGITEAGVLCKHFPEPNGMDWEYLQINSGLSTVFVPQGDGTSELLVILRPQTEIHIINTKWGTDDAYATSDVFLPHPTRPNYWKLISRKDDQLTLSTGEKTNPTPLEAILRQNPHVDAGLMFGRGRFQNGLLIQLKPEFTCDPRDEKTVMAYRSLVWPTVEQMNEFAPSHSRLFKEMIIFTDAAKPFCFNAKGAPRRSVILSQYDREIEALYNTVAERIDEVHPECWTYDASLAFVRSAVNRNLHNSAADDDDIFQCGCDSLQATWIRNTIIHALRDKQPSKARTIGTNFIYEHPRITTIARYITESQDEILPTSPVEAMISMLDTVASPGSFSATVASSTSIVSSIWNSLSYYSRLGSFSPAGDVVLITGTTGALGAATLAKLVSSTSVRRIYALNRLAKGSSQSLADRQRHALESKGYDAAVTSSPKVVLVESDITEEGLGVDASLENEIRTSVTHIIHIAWRVDFNLSLSSYTKILKGMRTLVNVALKSPRTRPPKFIFTSSVGIVRNYPVDTPVLETHLDDPEIAKGQGYSESKWIGEQMLYAAAKETSLRPVVLRVGQISGGVNGGWNTSDWVPSIVKSSVALGCLPRLGGTCTWLPLDVAADAIMDYCNADVDTIHLIHPQPQPSRAVFEAIGNHLNLPLIPYADWIYRLSAVAPSEVENVPALKLLEWFKAGLVDGQEEAIGMPPLHCEVAKRMSAHLRYAPPIKTSDITAWMEYWMTKGFLPVYT